VKKLKIALICHFSTGQIRRQLPLGGFKLENNIRGIFSKPPKKFNDFAPWIPSLITEIEGFEDVELHVISPHIKLKKTIYSFLDKGIYYHFFKPDIFTLCRQIWRLCARPQNESYAINRYLVKKIVKKINPDIINLFGTENPYYSSTVLDIHEKPIFVTLQTVYSNPKRKLYSEHFDQSRWDMEQLIFKKEKYYGSEGPMHTDLVRSYKEGTIILKQKFTKDKTDIPTGKLMVEYDFAFFSQHLSDKKGMTDAIKALALVSKKHPQVSMIVIGAGSKERMGELKNKLQSHEIEKNVIFTGYFSEHADALRAAQTARFALLPVKLDHVSSTILEAMHLGLPVVCYRTTGTPLINRDKETILLSDIGDIQGLADSMIKLLEDSEYAKVLRTNAKEYVEREYDNTANARLLVNCLRAVYENYYYQTPIPSELFFEVEDK
jgi:glycosyltransferase involved in cell wall biosynthesis